MQQKNTKYRESQDYHKRSICKCILNHPSLYELPLTLSGGWDAIPENSKELYSREEELMVVMEGISNRTPYHFLKLMLGKELCVEALFKYVGSKNDCIERDYAGSRFDEETIFYTGVKTNLIQKHIRFLLSAIEAYKRISSEYTSLPIKTHLTKDIIVDELTESMALSQMIQSLTDENGANKNNEKFVSAIDEISKEGEVFQSLSAYLCESDNPIIKFIQEEGITLNELKKNYPLYRSKFKAKNDLINSIQVYSYCFFYNNFTCDKQETAVMFAYSTSEYIRSAVSGDDYLAYIHSTQNSYRKKFISLKKNLSYAVSHNDIFLCNLKDGSRISIGIYFPFLNSSYTETIPF